MLHTILCHDVFSLDKKSGILTALGHVKRGHSMGFGEICPWPWRSIAVDVH